MFLLACRGFPISGPGGFVEVCFTCLPRYVSVQGFTVGFLGLLPFYFVIAVAGLQATLCVIPFVAVGGSPSVAMLGKGRIQGDLGSCLGKAHGAVPMSFSPATPSYPFTPPLPGFSPCGAAPRPRLPLASANGRRGALYCARYAVARYVWLVSGVQPEKTVCAPPFRRLPLPPRRDFLHETFTLRFFTFPLFPARSQYPLP